MSDLPELIPEHLNPTRDRLQDAAHVIGSLQRAFMPKDPHDWQYGLEVSMRGLATQPFTAHGRHLQASLDLVRHKLRLGSSQWSLDEYDGPELLNNVRSWLEAHNVDAALEQPPFSKPGRFDQAESDKYAAALWWLNDQLMLARRQLQHGLTAPILLYPHHFDLSLVWFPFSDKRQLAVGFSTGDAVIGEPYIYLTAYPEPTGFGRLELPEVAYWQAKGFSGAVLPYRLLQASKDPEKLLAGFIAMIFEAGQQLLIKN